MYLSRLSFCTLPGKTHEAAQNLNTLIGLIADGSANRPRVLRASLMSPGGCDLQLEQEVDSLAALESDLRRVAAKPEFQRWILAGESWAEVRSGCSGRRRASPNEFQLAHRGRGEKSDGRG